MADTTALAKVAQTGDQAAVLAALRDRLAAEIDDENTCARDIAALSRQLVDVLARLAVMSTPKVRTVDQLAKKRANRQRRAAATR
jgi:hypothetical protein